MQPLYLYRSRFRYYGKSAQDYVVPAFNRADAIEKTRSAHPGCEVLKCECEAPPETAFLIHRARLLQCSSS